MNNIFGLCDVIATTTGSNANWTTPPMPGAVIYQIHDSVGPTYYYPEDRTLLSNYEWTLYETLRTMYHRQRMQRLTMVYRPARSRPHYQNFTNSAHTEHWISSTEDIPVYTRNKASGCHTAVRDMNENAFLSSGSDVKLRSVFKPFVIKLRPKRPPYSSRYASGLAASASTSNPNTLQQVSGQWQQTDLTTVTGGFQPAMKEHYQLYIKRPNHPDQWREIAPPIDIPGQSTPGYNLGWIHFWATIQFCDRKADNIPE